LGAAVGAGKRYEWGLELEQLQEERAAEEARGRLQPSASREVEEQDLRAARRGEANLRIVRDRRAVAGRER
jgi:hypothetical protein